MTSAAQHPDLNPVSPQNLLNPVPLYTALRENAPVHWSDEIHAWLITRYTDVMNCFRDPRLSSNRTKFFEAQIPDPNIIRDLIDSAQNQMIMKDGTEHIRVRRQALAAFTPQLIQSWRPQIRRVMEELMEQVQSRGRMDLVREISSQLPVRVIAELFGIPTEDRERFQEWSEPPARFSAPSPGVDVMELARQANTAIAALRDYLTMLVEKRRHEPGQDMISRMLQVQEEHARMSLAELVHNALLILTAGHLTTTDQTSNIMYDLLSNPDQLQKLRENPGLLRATVEEGLRFSPAAPFIPRVAVESFQLHDRTIRKGDVVFLGMAAANRDPEAFPDPDRFDITRSSHSKHLSFAFGQHHCLGAGLARSELEIFLEVLLQRLPDLRLDEEQQPQIKCYSLAFRGFEVLPLRW